VQTTPLTICNPTVSPHVSDISNLSYGLIMDMRIGLMLLSKAKDPTECSVINIVVSTVYHPVDIISELVIEICSIKLSNHLLIPVILESHDV
jgi:hypothetical protein